MTQTPESGAKTAFCQLDVERALSIPGQVGHAVGGLMRRPRQPDPYQKMDQNLFAD